MDTEHINTAPEQGAAPNAKPPENPKAILEAILFAASEPISLHQFQEVLPELDKRTLRNALNELQDDYWQMERSFQLVEIANGYQIRSDPHYAAWIQKFYTRQVRVKLTPSALETLAIVAYKQPITRTDVASLRGVNSDSVLNSLVEKGLVCIAGRKEGRSLLFSTTDLFLHQFGLKDPSELPSLEEIDQLLSTSNGEEPHETEAEGTEATEVNAAQ